MPELRLEGGSSRIEENPASRQILQEYDIFRKIHNWRKSTFGGNSETWGPIIKNRLSRHVKQLILWLLKVCLLIGSPGNLFFFS